MIKKNNLKNTRLVFFGTPEFAVPTLNALHNEGYGFILAITQPDQPVGRKKILTALPVKATALKLGLKVLDNLQDLAIEAKKFKPELGIVAAYGKIIPQAILDLFPAGVLNIHPSLLPKYRGPAPLQNAILNGDAETGVTIIKLDDKMDHGPIVASLKYPLLGRENAENLGRKLAQTGAQLLVKTLPDFLAGKIKPQPQNEVEATYVKMINKEDGQIDWQKTAKEVDQQIRAYTPWPGSFAALKVHNKFIKVKILTARPIEDPSFASPGDWQIKNEELHVRCGKGSLMIKTLQPEGKNESTAEQFINGYLRK